MPELALSELAYNSGLRKSIPEIDFSLHGQVAPKKYTVPLTAFESEKFVLNPRTKVQQKVKKKKEEKK